MEIECCRSEEFKKGNKIHIIPFFDGEEIDFKREFDGSSCQLVKLGKLSREIGGLLMVGKVSNNCGIKRQSVFVFESGKLIEICDMNCYKENFAQFKGCKIISFGNVKIGILVDKDLFFPTLTSALCQCGCSVIINLYGDLCTKKAKISAEFYSYVYGVDFILCAKDKSLAFNSMGKLSLWKGKGNINFKRRFCTIKSKGFGPFGNT